MQLNPDTLEPVSATIIEGGQIGGGLYADGRFFIPQGDENPRIVVMDPAD